MCGTFLQVKLIVDTQSEVQAEALGGTAAEETQAVSEILAAVGRGAEIGEKIAREGAVTEKIEAHAAAGHLPHLLPRHQERLGQLGVDGGAQQP